MTLRVVDQGEGHFLTLILGVDYHLKLFTNDVENGLTEPYKEALYQGDFTEATFTGYSAKTLTGGSWTIDTNLDPASGVYAMQTFTSTADQTPEDVYGYYVTRASDGALEWYEYFSASAAPSTIQYNYESINVTPTLTLTDASE
jgi:hypothetical protein